MTQAIVLDKSYLDGASTQAVRTLCERYMVLVSDELFYELLTTRRESQTRCFSKLPNTPNPVTLIPNVGSLLRYEMENQSACTPVHRHKIQETFQFNEQLRQGTYEFEGETRDHLEEWKKTIAEDTNSFIARWEVVHQFFPELNGIEYKTLPTAVEGARIKIAKDEDFVREIYASFLDADAPANSPPAAMIFPEWAFYRWVQCQVLTSLRLFGRHQGRPPDTPGKEFLKKAEHSMLDTYHLIHGVLVGAMATRDTEIQQDLLLLLPDSVIVGLTE